MELKVMVHKIVYTFLNPIYANLSYDFQMDKSVCHSQLFYRGGGFEADPQGIYQILYSPLYYNVAN